MIACRTFQGFTLVELVTVMTIIGILGAMAGPRFFDTDVFASNGFAADSRATLRYAQKLALASGCSIAVDFTATGYTVSRWIGAGGCTDRTGTLTTVMRPGGGMFSTVAPAGVTVSTASFFFDSIGRPRRATDGAILSAPVTITIAATALSVEPETGLVN